MAAAAPAANAVRPGRPLDTQAMAMPVADATEAANAATVELMYVEIAATELATNDVVAGNAWAIQAAAIAAELLAVAIAAAAVAEI